ncbi:MAG: O-antigen ligase family protein [Thermodesulfobacteriota bacterium]|nr:O-antigen ligase family protein [Thermodesulfobacteriota bacterium]
MIKANNIDSRTVFLLLIIAGVTFLAGIFITKVSTGAAFLAIAALTILVASFLSAEVALYMLIISMLLSPEFVVGGLGGGGTTAGRGATLRFDDILLVIIGFSWFLKTAIRKDLGLFLRTSLNRPIAYYFVICLVATLLGLMMGRVRGLTGFFFVLKYFEYFIVYFMVVNHLRDKRHIERFIAVMLIVCFIVCIVSIAQIPAGGRVTAPFEGEVGEPNTLGGYLILMLSITLGLLLTYGSKKQKSMFAALIFFIVISLAATLSRSSWIALPPMLITLIYFSKRKMVVIVPLIVIIAIAPFVLPHAVKERVLFTFTQRQQGGQMEIGGAKIDTSTSARLTSWKIVLTRDFIKHPILGYGVTGYTFLDAQYPRVLAETGLAGLLAFLLLLVAIYRNALHTYRNASDPLFSGLSLGYLAGFIAMLVHSVGANTFIIVRIMEPFWFLTAIIIMIPTIEAEELKTKAESIEQGARSIEQGA